MSTSEGAQPPAERREVGGSCLFEVTHLSAGLKFWISEFAFEVTGIFHLLDVGPSEKSHILSESVPPVR